MNVTVNEAETLTMTLTLNEARALFWSIDVDSISERQVLDGHHETLMGLADEIESEMGAALEDSWGTLPESEPEPVSNVIAVDFGTDGLFSPAEIDKALEDIRRSLQASFNGGQNG